LLLSHGYKGFFLLQFHCELNTIERVWAHSKAYTRVHCDYIFKGLESQMTPALDSVCLDTIIIRIFLDYIAAYKESLSPGPELVKAMKKYKSHLKIYDEERTD